MPEPTPTSPENAQNETQNVMRSQGAIENLTSRALRAVNNADERAAIARATELRAQHPTAEVPELVEMLIKQKCIETGTVGAVTSGTALIPGLGTIASMSLGTVADIGLTLKMQAELVLEIAAVYGYEFNPNEKQQALLMVTGISVGADKLLSQAGRRLAQETSERIAQKSVAKAIPFVGMVASASANVLSTYLIGRRAQAYFSMGPKAVGDWSESARAITGVDERKMIAWLSENISETRQSVADSVKDRTTQVRRALAVRSAQLRGILGRSSAQLSDSGLRQARDEEDT